MLSRTARTLLTSAKSHGQRRWTGGDVRFRYPSMDELPVPQGSWKHAHDAAQRKNNTILLLGVVFFSSTVTYFLTSKSIDLGTGIKYGKNVEN